MKTLIQIQKEKIQDLFNSTSLNFELTYPSDNLITARWERSSYEYIEFNIGLGENFNAVEIFENPADEWNYNFNNIDKFYKSVEERY